MIKGITFTIIALFVVGLATTIKNREDIISDLRADNKIKDLLIQEKDSLLKTYYKIKIEHIEDCLIGSDEDAMREIFIGTYKN